MALLLAVTAKQGEKQENESVQGNHSLRFIFSMTHIAAHEVRTVTLLPVEETPDALGVNINLD